MGRSPAAARKRLGLVLRNLRERSGKGLVDAADALDCSPSKISRLENGKGVPRARDIRDLIELYAPLSEDDTDELYALAADGRGQGWWDPFRKALDGSMIPDHLVRFVALETDAVALREFQPELVPGLLQERAYVEAVIELYFAEYSDAERRALVDFRLGRQAVLARPDAPNVRIVMGEAALRRRIGGDAVLAEQFGALAAKLTNGLAEHVELRIAPLSLAIPAALSGPFAILDFPAADDESLVYVEGGAGATYIEEDAEVKKYEARFEALWVECLSGEESVERVKEASQVASSA